MKLNVKLKSQTRAHSHARALHHTDSNGLLYTLVIYVVVLV